MRRWWSLGEGRGTREGGVSCFGGHSPLAFLALLLMFSPCIRLTPFHVVLGQRLRGYRGCTSTSALPTRHLLGTGPVPGKCGGLLFIAHM